MSERVCLTCWNWIRITRFPDIGFCELMNEHPVKRLRCQFEDCEGYQGEAPRKPYQGVRQNAIPDGWSNKRVYMKELAR